MDNTFILLDDRNAALVLRGDWYFTALQDWIKPWYNLTSAVPFSGASIRSNMSITFEGVGLLVFGVSRDRIREPQMKITLDPDIPQSTSLPSPSLLPDHYGSVFTSPNLTEGSHTLHFNNCDTSWANVDLTLVRVGRDTPLLGKTLLVDDSDRQVEYIGVGWVKDGSTIGGLIPETLDPMLQTSHQTSTPGDMITFRFYGTSVSLRGIFSWSRISNIIVVYTLDGQPERRSYPVTEDAPDYDSKQDALHFIYYSAKDLAPALHVLTVNVTGIQNTTFRFDYITYEPSFHSMASMPPIPLGPPPTTAPMIAVPTSTITPKSARQSLVPKVVGGFLGGFVIIALVLVALIRLRIKKRRKELEHERIISRNARVTPFTTDRNGLGNNVFIQEVAAPPLVDRRVNRITASTVSRPPPYETLTNLHQTSQPHPIFSTDGIGKS